MCVCCAKAGKTALHVAAMHGHTDIVDLILQNAVDVDHTDRVSSVKPKFHLARHISRLDTSRHVRRVERVETSVSSRAVRQAPRSLNALARHVERVESCRDVT